MISAVISDLGKVILNFDNGIFFRKMTAYCPLTEKEIREAVHKSPEFVVLFDSGKITPREFYSRVTAKLGARISYDEFFAAYADVFSLHPPAFQILTKLRGRYRLILLSNTDVVRFTFIKSKFPEILIFDGYVLSYEVGSMKPEPGIYRAALKSAAVPAREAVFIDDIEVNVRAAEALGLRGVVYTPKSDLEKELSLLGLSL
jgi:HAD superfamily hydrolase (TIGR01509 family)